MLGQNKSVDEASILEALRTVEDPDLHKDIVSLGFIKDLRVSGGRVSFKLELTTPACPMKDALRTECLEKVKAIGGVEDVDIEMTSQVRRAVPLQGTVLEGVRNVVAVASGKGGVGKSTAAANLALALHKAGASVGLLDADVYGPSMALMFGLDGSPRILPGGKIVPLEGHGVKVISMGFLTDQDQPVIWRGPMIHSLLEQFLREVEWGELDYLVVDMPPGTGDAQLSLAQLVAVSGAVIVTTPQDVSLVDARKGLMTFRRLNIAVLGIIENMSYFVCPHCDGRTDIFRHGGGKRTSDELGVPFLGEIPIDPRIVIGSDEGRPIVVEAPDSPAAKAYKAVAGQVAAQLSKLAGEGNPPQGPITLGPVR